MKQQIETALRAFSGSDLRAASIGLLNSLGYKSEKTLDLDNTPDAFLAEFDKRDREFRTDKAMFERWKSVEFLFQITDDEVQSAGGQGTLFDSGYDHGNYQSYLFFALDLEKNHYTRTQLADITREINLLFDMPAMLLIRHNGALTFSVIDRRLHKKDQSRDVLEKVKLIKDIHYQDPHRAHIEILHDLALPTLMAKHECRDFKRLHEAWRTTLDTNELNKKFYRELADWYFWALDQVEFPADVEKDESTRNATSVIRLLTRLIFCWFLKEKGLIPAELFSERKLATVLKSLKDDDSTFYRAILQNLFFGTLNQRMNTSGRENRRFANDGPFLERKNEYGVKNLYRYQKLFAIAEEEAIKLFSDIPFLNGGLFDCLDKEDDTGKVIYVDGFTRNARKQPKVPNFLFFSDYQTLDLSDAYGDKKKKKEKVRGLINLLDSYKFTITENTPIEEEIALDPELLGKVFENLLASYNPETGTTARKQTGSFYTPREIVNYMVDESLIAYLEGQLKAMVPKLAEMKDLQDLLREVFAYTEKVHPFDEEEVDALIDAIDKCKILDPACGSGAFPMGILHKLVFILGKLDPNNERWKQRQITKAEQIPDVSTREVAVSAIEKDFETNDLNYGRKLYLIENCIYGVDIQPIAIQISKLRFFISLICDQRTNKNKAQNCGVRPLPNLETKFVAANTLISLDRGQDQLLLTDPRLAILEKELAAVRHRHFAAQRRRNKLALQRRDAEIRKEIAVVLTGSMSVEASHQLAAWDPYDQNTSAPFFDPEWMFGVMDGFDGIIGNPPYIPIESMQQGEKNYYAAHFPQLTRKYDSATVFILSMLEALAPDGVLVYISSVTWQTGQNYCALREHLFKKHGLRILINLPFDMFKAAYVDTGVYLISKEPTTNYCIYRFPKKSTSLDMSALPLERVPVSLVEPPNYKVVLNPFAVALIKKATESGRCVTFGEITDSTQGLAGSRFPRTRLSAGPDVMSFLCHGQVYRYVMQIEQTYNTDMSDKRSLIHYYEAVPRLVVRRVINRQDRLMAALCDERLVFKKDLNPFLITDKRYEPEYLLGILNSRLISYLYVNTSAIATKDDFRQTTLAELRQLPIPRPAHNEGAVLVSNVKKTIRRKRLDASADTAELERQIDQIVYHLYNLTPDEIAIVEDKSV